MKKKDTIVRNSLSFPAVLVGVAMFSGLFMYTSSHTRQYSPGNMVKADKDDDAGAAGMARYFFNARKNPATDSLDYMAMLQTEQQIEKANASKRAMGTLGLNFRSLGPGNIGGRTRAILIDKNDPSGQTMFAGAVSGGIWKSLNGGATWDSVAGSDQLSSMSICSIAQDDSGHIFLGTGEGFAVGGYPTGEGFSCGILGGGMFKSRDDGATFQLMPATTPSATNSINATWAYINRIAILPNNPAVIYAATNGGLMVSTNGGTTFTYAMSGTTKISTNSLDVKASPDGNLVVACCSGNAYYLYPSVSTTNFTLIHQSGYGKLLSSGNGRIELAISPTNSNYVYASVIGPYDAFIGIYMTMTAVSSGNGGNWYDIGPGGSKSFDPYSSGGVQDQGTYDNTIGVTPTNPGKAYFGGTTLWSWAQTSSTDTAGEWTNVTHYYSYGAGDPIYVHPDMHAIVYDFANPNTMFIGCDGGVYKSTDGGGVWFSANRNYDVTQFYAIAFSPYMNSNGEGVIGGTQDNGTPYMSGYGLTTSSSPGQYYQDGVDLGGGDGGQAAISSINPNAYYVSADDNTLLRSANLSGYGSPSNAYTNTQGLDKGANIDSVYGLGSGCFVDAIALYENFYTTKTLDKLLWVSDTNYKAGDTIYPISPNGNFPFPYVTPTALVKGDSIIVPNPVVSKLATAFTPSNGIWINMQAIDFQDPTVWMPVGGPDSRPDAITGSSPFHCLAWSPDGDALFAGTESGSLYRISNLDSILDTSYVTGGLFSCINAHSPVVNPLSRAISLNLTSALNDGANDILSIEVDPNNGNNVMVTTGAYVGGTHVYYSTNALASSGVTFTTKQGTGLPEMPVYGGVLDLVHGPTTSALLATEHGIYTTGDITAASPVWSIDNNGMANTLVCAAHQQTLPAWLCNNSGDIYLGTHGRGAYVDTTFLIRPNGIPQISTSAVKIDLKVYPNPMNVGGTIAFTLPKSDKDVTITIYDIQGRMVQQMPMGAQGPGVHTLSISSQNMNVGTYLATITGTNFQQTTRFIVVR